MARKPLEVGGAHFIHIYVRAELEKKIGENRENACNGFWLLLEKTLQNRYKTVSAKKMSHNRKFCFAHDVFSRMYEELPVTLTRISQRV